MIIVRVMKVYRRVKTNYTSWKLDKMSMSNHNNVIVRGLIITNQPYFMVGNFCFNLVNLLVKKCKF